jgi:hypothetical protein
VPVSVDAGRDQGVHRHDPAALADLKHQRIGRDEGERSRLGQRPSAELLDVGIKLGGHVGDLRLGQCGDPQTLHELVHAPSADAEQVARRHHRRQRPLGPLARSSSHSGKYEPWRSLGIATSIVPVRVSKSRAGSRYAGWSAIPRSCRRRRRTRRRPRPRAAY